MNELNKRLAACAVIGAAGKMGRGIALLLLQEMASLYASKTIHEPALFLIDSNDILFPDLRHYLKTQLLRFAEKNIIFLRKCYAEEENLVSNAEIIEAFIERSLNFVYFESEIQKAKNAHLVFEAIVEDIEVKEKIFSTLKSICQPDTYYLTNTSSIPIHTLNSSVHLKGKIIGFHFYNPPPVQKLLEIIIPEGIDPHLKNLAEELGKRLKKTIVYSHDIAGFIGNGYFLREAVFAFRQVNEMAKGYGLAEAVYMVNRIYQDFLLRPMGIFQLLDYVGLDVCQKICAIMSEYIPNELFRIDIVDQMLLNGIKGGQQKDGFFHYEKNGIIGVYSLERKEYLPIQPISEKMDKVLGELPKGHESWKNLLDDKEKAKKIQDYFKHLFNRTTLGSELAKEYINQTAMINKMLVEDGVANSLEDVDRVLINGFYHLYSPTKMCVYDSV